MYNKYFKANDINISAFTLNRFKRKENFKYIIFSKSNNNNNHKIDLFFQPKTKISFLNKNLVYPKSILAIDLNAIEKDNRKKKIKGKVNSRLRYSSNKMEKLMFLRKEARKLLKKKKKYRNKKKKKKKIRKKKKKKIKKKYIIY